MSDVLTITDLEAAKKHDTFHSEVITGRGGGSASGAEIDTATNAVTGQVQTTLPKVLRDVGFKPASFNFVTGGTLGVTDADKCIYNPAPAGDDNWYSWGGALPHDVDAGTDPVAVGSGYVPRTDVVLRSNLSGDNGAILVGASIGITNSTDRTVKDVTDRFVSVLDFYRPVEDGGDYAKAVIRGFAQVKHLYFPHRNDGTPWAVNTQFSIPANGSILLDRCNLKCSTYIDLIKCVGIAEPTIIANGNCTISGPRTGVGSETSCSGLTLTDCYKPTIAANGRLTFSDWTNRGWISTSTSFTGAPAFGYVCNVDTRNNTVGWDLGDGDACEYWTLVNVNSYSNVHGVYFKSPNTTVTGGGATHNVTNGLHVISGFNDGHSSFTGFKMNHNGVNNLYCYGINTGVAFSNCQLFDDGVGTNTGKINIESCKGITWNGGEINADFVTTGACAGNTFSNAYFVSDSRAYAVTGDDAAKRQLFFNRCSSPAGSGSAKLNTNGFGYTVGYTSGAQAVVIPAGVATNVPVTTVSIKSVGAEIYDSALGVWVARNAGRYSIDGYIDLWSTNSTMPQSGMYATVKVDGYLMYLLPFTALSLTDATLKFNCEFENLAVGNQIEIAVIVPSGTVNFRTRTRVSATLL